MNLFFENLISIKNHFFIAWRRGRFYCKVKCFCGNKLKKISVKKFLETANLSKRELFYKLVEVGHPDWWRSDSNHGVGTLVRCSSHGHEFYETHKFVTLVLETGTGGKRSVEIQRFPSLEREITTLDELYDQVKRDFTGSSFRRFLERGLLKVLA